MYIIVSVHVCACAWYVCTVFRWWPRERTVLISFQLSSRTSFPRIQRYMPINKIIVVLSLSTCSVPIPFTITSLYLSLSLSSLCFPFTFHCLSVCFSVIVYCHCVSVNIESLCLNQVTTLFETISLPISLLQYCIVFREYHVMQCPHCLMYYVCN